MSIRFPIYTYIGVDGYQMYPGTPDEPGLHHDFKPGLHLIAGVNGLGKSTCLFLLYNGVVGPAAVRNDDFGVPQPEITPRRDAEKFRRRVADGARNARSEVHFAIGDDRYEVTRSLYDLSLAGWKLNGTEQAPNNQVYVDAIVSSMNVGSFADVITILNLIVFMFESRSLLMWNPLAQRNALRALFMTPAEANQLAERAQMVATANSAYRNLLYIVNRERKQLARDKAALAAADALSTEYHTLQKAIDAHNENYANLLEKKRTLDESRAESQSTLETAKYNYDDILREIEALKLARVASTFPKADDSSQYIIAHLIGNHECLACGAEDGPLIEKWMAFVAEGHCLVCGSSHEVQEAVVPQTAVDALRMERASIRLSQARQTLDTATDDAKQIAESYNQVQAEIDAVLRTLGDLKRRVNQIAGSLPPSHPAVQALDERIKKQAQTLEELQKDQIRAEEEFSEVFDRFRTSIEQKADLIRQRFSRKISEFLVERAEISLSFARAPIGESGQSYNWPTFQLSMTSGAFDAPAPRRSRSEVSMSQGEFIDLAFRLALVEAAEAGPATMIFDAPEASLDALFMRRAGAFLAQFTKDNPENRLIVTSNLTNADMIPALFGAYEPQEGDPEPQTIPRSERRDRVIDLLELAAPTSAVYLVGNRYKNLLDRALFPPNGYAEAGL